MRFSPREINTHLATLQETPLLIGSGSEALAESHLRTSLEPGDWTLFEHLVHLSACAEIWGDDIAQMLALDGPSFTKPHPNTVMRSPRLLERSFAELARAFAVLRDRLLEMLRPLGPEQWERGATINGRYHTVYTQTRRMALHETAHTVQIREIWGVLVALERDGSA
jgi:hypothetical protein